MTTLLPLKTYSAADAGCGHAFPDGKGNFKLMATYLGTYRHFQQSLSDFIKVESEHFSDTPRRS